MTRLRVIVLAVLFSIPFLVLFAIGGYHLWETHCLWVWWPILACFVSAYLLSWRWTRMQVNAELGTRKLERKK
jgi:hypothetical protein